MIRCTRGKRSVKVSLPDERSIISTGSPCLSRSGHAPSSHIAFSLSGCTGLQNRLINRMSGPANQGTPEFLMITSFVAMVRTSLSSSVKRSTISKALRMPRQSSSRAAVPADTRHPASLSATRTAVHAASMRTGCESADRFERLLAPRFPRSFRSTRGLLGCDDATPDMGCWPVDLGTFAKFILVELE